MYAITRPRAFSQRYSRVLYKGNPNAQFFETWWEFSQGIGDSISGGVFKSQCFFGCDSGGARLLANRDLEAYNIWTMTIEPDNTPGKRRIKGFLNGLTTDWYSGGLAGISGDDYEPPISTGFPLLISDPRYSFEGEMVELILYSETHSDATVTSNVQELQDSYFLACPQFTTSDAQASGGAAGADIPDPLQCGVSSASRVPYGSQCSQECNTGTVRVAGAASASVCNTGAWGLPPVSCSKECAIQSAPKNSATCYKVVFDLQAASASAPSRATDLSTGLPTALRSFWLRPSVPAVHVQDYWRFATGLSSGPFAGQQVLLSDALTSSCDAAAFAPTFLAQASPRWAQRMIQTGAVHTYATFSLLSRASAPAASEWLAVSVRVRDAGTHFRVQVSPSQGGGSVANLQLIQVVSGSESLLASSSVDLPLVSGVASVGVRTQGNSLAVWAVAGSANWTGLLASVDAAFTQIGVFLPSTLPDSEYCEKLGRACEGAGLPVPVMCVAEATNPWGPSSSIGMLAHAQHAEISSFHVETSCDGGNACQHALDGTSCEWSCDRGFVAVNGTAGGVLCQDGQWGGKAPTCVVRPPSPESGVTRNISELAPGGTEVLPAVNVQVEAAGVAILYELTGTSHIDADTGVELFSIGTCSGVITLQAGGILDFETKSAFVLRVKATPAGAENPEQSSVAFDVPVFVNDEPEPPSFDFRADAANNASLILRTFYRFAAENSPANTPLPPLLPASDPDIGGSTDLIFSIDSASVLVSKPTPGQPSPAIESAALPPLPFSMDRDTGLLSTTRQLDAEATPGYELYVRVTDRFVPSLFDTATVVITVQDLNDPPRLPTSQPAVDLELLAFAANRSTGASVLAFDDDGDDLVFSLVRVQEIVPNAGVNLTRAFRLDAALGTVLTAQDEADLPALSGSSVIVDGRQVVGAWQLFYTVHDVRGLQSVPSVASINVHVLANASDFDRQPRVLAVTGVPTDGFSSGGGQTVSFAAADLDLTDAVSGTYIGTAAGGRQVQHSAACMVLGPANLTCTTSPFVGTGFRWQFSLRRSGSGAAVFLPFQSAGQFIFSANPPSLSAISSGWQAINPGGGQVIVISGNGFPTSAADCKVLWQSGTGGFVYTVDGFTSSCSENSAGCISAVGPTEVTVRLAPSFGATSVRMFVVSGGQTSQGYACDSGSTSSLCGKFQRPQLQQILAADSNQAFFTGISPADPHNLVPGDQAFVSTSGYLVLVGAAFGSLPSQVDGGAPSEYTVQLHAHVDHQGAPQLVAEQRIPGTALSGGAALTSSTVQPNNALLWRPPSAVGTNLTVRICMVNPGASGELSWCSLDAVPLQGPSVSYTPPVISTIVGSSDLSTRGGDLVTLEVLHASGPDILLSSPIAFGWFGNAGAVPAAGSSLDPWWSRPAAGGGCPFNATHSPAEWTEYVSISCSVSGRTFPDPLCATTALAETAACRLAPYTVTCVTPPGTGAAHTWVLATVGCSLSTVAGFSAYAPPSISAFDGAEPQVRTTQLAAAGGQPLHISGRNFGPVFRTAPELELNWHRGLRFSTLGAAHELTAKSLRKLTGAARSDFAWYTLQLDTSAASEQQYVVFPAKNCSMTEPHAELRCTTAPGAGAALQWSLLIGGQSNVPVTTAYAAPQVTNLQLMSTQGMPVSTADPEGGTVLRIDGSDFGPAAGCPDSAALPAEAAAGNSSCLGVPIVYTFASGVRSQLSNVTLVPGGWIEALLPPGIASSVRVVVQRGGQQSALSGKAFSYTLPRVGVLSPVNGTAGGTAASGIRFLLQVSGVPSDPGVEAQLFLGNPAGDGSIVGPIAATKVLKTDPSGLPLNPSRVEAVEARIPPGAGSSRGVYLRLQQVSSGSASNQNNTITVWGQGFATFSYFPPSIAFVGMEFAWERPEFVREAALLWGLPANDTQAVQALGIRRVTLFGSNFGANPALSQQIPLPGLQLPRVSSGGCNASTAAELGNTNAAQVCPFASSKLFFRGIFAAADDSLALIAVPTAATGPVRFLASSWWTNEAVTLYTTSLQLQVVIAVASRTFVPPADIRSASIGSASTLGQLLVQSSSPVQISGTQPLFGVSARSAPAAGYSTLGGQALLALTDYGTLQSGSDLEVAVGSAAWPGGVASCPVVVADGWGPAPAAGAANSRQPASNSPSGWQPEGGIVPSAEAGAYVRSACAAHYGSGLQLTDLCYFWCVTPPGEGGSVPVQVQRGSAQSSTSFIAYALPSISATMVLDTSATGREWAQQQAQADSTATAITQGVADCTLANTLGTQGGISTVVCVSRSAAAVAAQPGVVRFQVGTYGASLMLTGSDFGLCPFVSIGLWPPIPTCNSNDASYQAAVAAWEGTPPLARLCSPSQGVVCSSTDSSASTLVVQIPPGSGYIGVGIALSAGGSVPASVSTPVSFRPPVVSGAAPAPAARFPSATGLLRAAGGDLVQIIGDQFGVVPGRFSSGFTAGLMVELSHSDATGPWSQCSDLSAVPGGAAGTIPAPAPPQRELVRESQTSIVCSVPPGVGSGVLVRVTVAGLASQPQPLFAYDPPMVWKASVLSQAGGSLVRSEAFNNASRVLASVFGGASNVPAGSQGPQSPPVQLRARGGDILMLEGTNFGSHGGSSSAACVFLRSSLAAPASFPDCDGMESFPGEGELFFAGPALMPALPLNQSSALQTGAVLEWSNTRVVLLTPPIGGQRSLDVAVGGQRWRTADAGSFTLLSEELQVHGLRAPPTLSTGGGDLVTFDISGLPAPPPSPEAAASGRLVAFPKSLPVPLANQLPDSYLRVLYARTCRTNAVDPTVGLSPDGDIVVPAVLGTACSTEGGTVISQTPEGATVTSSAGLGADNSVVFQLLDAASGAVHSEVATSISYSPPDVGFPNPQVVYVRFTGNSAADLPESASNTTGAASASAADLQGLSLFGKNFGSPEDQRFWRAGDEAVAVNVSGQPCVLAQRASTQESFFSEFEQITCSMPSLSVGRKNVSVQVAGQIGLLPFESAQALQVVCAAAFYGRPTEQCLPCPDGATCSGFLDGVHTYPEAQEGWYNLNGSMFEAACTGLDVPGANAERRVCVVPCEPAEACAAGNVCQEGYESVQPQFRCASCAPQFYRRSGLCEPCPQQPWLPIAIFVTLAVCAAGGAYWLNTKKINLALVSIGVDYFQVLALFAGSRVAWPGFIREFFVLLSVFSFNIDIATPECALPNLQFEQQWFLIMFFPLGIACVLLLSFVVGYLYKRWWLGMYGRKHLCGHRGRLLATGVMAMYVLYLYLTRTGLDIFNCVPTDPPDGKLYLEVVFEPCGKSGGIQMRLLPYAIVGLLVYVIGYPLYVARVLQGHKWEIMEDQLLRAMGTGTSRLSNPHAYDVRKVYEKLYHAFKPDFAWWWMLVLLLRKLLMAATRNMFSKNAGFQMSLALLVMFVAYALQVRFRPFMSPSDRDAVLRDHRLKAFDEVPTHTRLAASLKEVAVRRRRRGKATSMSALSAQSSIADRANVAAAAVGSWLINYNSVEAILLFCGVLVTLSGIMFETGQLDSEIYQQQRDLLASAVLIVMIGSILYFVVVLVVEARLLLHEARDRDAAPHSKRTKASTGDGALPATDGTQQRARRFSFGIARLPGSTAAKGDSVLQGQRSGPPPAGSGRATPRKRRQSISEMSGIELSSYLKGSNSAPPVAGSHVALPVAEETVSNPMFAAAAKAGAASPADVKAAPGMDQHKELAQNILLMQGVPSEEQWGTIQGLYGDMVGMVAALQEQVKSLKREAAKAERFEAPSRARASSRAGSRSKRSPSAPAPALAPGQGAGSASTAPAADAPRPVSRKVSGAGPSRRASVRSSNPLQLSGGSSPPTGPTSPQALSPALSFAAAGAGTPGRSSGQPASPRRRRSIAATRKILNKKTVFGQDRPSAPAGDSAGASGGADAKGAPPSGPPPPPPRNP